MACYQADAHHFLDILACHATLSWPRLLILPSLPCSRSDVDLDCPNSESEPPQALNHFDYLDVLLSIYKQSLGIQFADPGQNSG